MDDLLTWLDSQPIGRIAATVQHVNSMQQLNEPYPGARRSVAALLAVRFRK
jgi:hypothetical protein